MCIHYEYEPSLLPENALQQKIQSHAQLTFREVLHRLLLLQEHSKAYYIRQTDMGKSK